MEHRRQLEVQQALQQQHALMKNFAKITHDCFLKCVTRPGKSLSHTEEACTNNCVDRYRDTQMFLIERLQAQAENEKSKQGSQGLS